MSAQMTAPFEQEYSNDTPKNTPPKLDPGPDTPERDSAFKASMSRLVSSLQESDASSRDRKEKMEGFDALSAFAGRQMKDDNERVNVNQGPAVAASAVAVTAAPNPQATREMNALLKTEMASKPLDGPKNTNQVAANTETASQGAKNKGQQAERGAEQLVKKADDLAAKMNPQELAGLQPKCDNLAGPVVEAALHATGHNMAAAAVAVATVSTGQGQGTYSTEKTASKPILSKSEERALAKAPTRYYDQAPQAIAAPTQPVNTQTQQFFGKMGTGPGFDTGRLVSQDSLKDLKVGNIEKVVENSRAFKSIKSAGIDADNTKQALLDMKDKGLVEEGGKQKLTPEMQAFVKPTAPSPPGFRA